MRILIVDDVKLALTDLQATLVEGGHEVETARNGSEALAALRGGRSHLVITDWEMPEMSGIELCRTIREEGLSGYVYVILLSGHDTPEDRVEGLCAGADDFIAKPFNPAEILARVAIAERILSLETRDKQRTTQLENANKELAAFSYSVSHDLRAPLRHIQGYCEMLSEAMDGQRWDEARHHLKVITRASVEMAQLIDDLLAFSQMGRAELQETHCNLDELVQTVIQGLEMATKGRNIAWRISPLPPVFGDPSMLKQVLVNLIGNAVKYSRSRDPAEIEIGCAGEEDGRTVLFVRDNGAGFDMKYAQKLFGVFQRLHRADEFEGTGIGLATVRRVVARHGGRTWAQGELNKGATIYFTLKPVTTAHEQEARTPVRERVDQSVFRSLDADGALAASLPQAGSVAA